MSDQEHATASANASGYRDRAARLHPTAALAIAVLVNAAFWGVSLASAPGPWPIVHVVAEFLSSSALILMSTNLMLVTRARPLERAYGGLDKLFTSHRLNGLTAVTLLSTHFLLMPESAGWAPSKIIGYPLLATLVVAVLVAIAPRAPWRKLVPLRYQDWKLTHRLQGVLVATGVTHSLLAHPFMLSLPLMRVWVYGFASLGLAAYVFRETIEPRLLQRHRYRVGRPVRVASDVLEIPLVPVSDAIRHTAGQFAFVRFEDGPSTEQHPFTISAAPSDGRLRFSVKASGDFTDALQTHLAEGSAARVEGPYGRFDFRRGGPRQLWLAGGIGITPFLAFLPMVEEDRDVRLVWTVHTTGDAMYVDEIQAVASTRPHMDFKVHATNTDGRLRIADLGLERPEELSAFLCGPVPMRDAFIRQLGELGVKRSRIHYEEFSLR